MKFIILAKWNNIDSIDAAAPMIFNVWMKKIGEVLLMDEIPEETLNLFNGRRSGIVELLRTVDDGNGKDVCRLYSRCCSANCPT